MKQVQRESTSLKVQPDLWKLVKIEAIKDGVDLSIFFEEALEFWIKRRKEFQKQC